MDALVNRRQLGADRGRPEDARVEHPGQREVVDVDVGARDLGRDVGPRERLADQPVLVHLLEGRLRIHRDLEALPAHKLGVAEAGSPALRPDEAVHHLEVFGREAESQGGEADERLARRRRGPADLDAAARDALAAGRGPLIGSECGIALDQREGLDRHVELFGHHLSVSDAGARAEIDLAHEERDRAVGVDREEGIEGVSGERLAEQAIAAGRLGAGAAWRESVEGE